MHSHEETFGETNSSFCLHYLSHSAEEREYGDFTECSAFSPESAYGQLIRLIKTGTPSEAKRALLNYYSKLKAEKDEHRCSTNLTFSTKISDWFDNTLVALTLCTFGKIIEINDDELTVLKINTAPYGVGFSKYLQ